MESFPNPESTQEKFTEERQEVVKIIQEQKFERFSMHLEQENDFDESWLAIGSKEGFSISDSEDQPGRYLHKDGLSIKLKHYEFKPKGNKVYIAEIKSSTPGVKPSSFTFSFNTQFIPEDIEAQFKDVLNRYQNRYN